MYFFHIKKKWHVYMLFCIMPPQESFLFVPLAVLTLDFLINI